MKNRRDRKLFRIVTGVVVVGGLFAPLTVHTRTHHTCVLCRARRTDHASFGFEWRTAGTNAFSEWHAANRPAHEHVWERSSCTRGSNAFGQPTSWECRPIHPIGELPPDIELAFAKLTDGATLTALLQDVVSPDRETQRRAVDHACKWTLARRE